MHTEKRRLTTPSVGGQSMDQGIHIDENPPFILMPGVKIIIPLGVTKYFVCPHLAYGARMLPRMAYLQAITGESGSPTRFRFSKKSTKRGLSLFLPDKLEPGNEIVVIWREQRSAAAVLATQYASYRVLFDKREDVARDPWPAGWD